MIRTILRDDQWERLKDHLPGKPGDKGRSADNRLFLEAVLWMARTGAPWRDLPPSFGNWHSVYTRFKRWLEKGVWSNLFDLFKNDADLEQLLIDSTSIRAHQHSSGAQKKPGHSVSEEAVAV